MKYFFNALEKYATFSGRARRKEYWYFMLFHGIFVIFFSVFDLYLEFSLTYPLYALATLLPILALNARRMHDVGKSAWYMFIPIYSFILTLMEGDTGPNNYGPDPKNPEFEEFLQEEPIN
ncbi:MAG: DUF805 domain-containing protein [Candidatus Pseudobacter hemicellulosilyticus]|uniref:DUF805 domain-containing protein n=1 Tax=Candidatus Pseudobacter hemicellulosilyticus TaxID=3121375 RepID=A0AAJ5WUA6_9BACT|nr:MAG: DUF805 domain-containing protein [Pseudobacter sp.]